LLRKLNGLTRGHYFRFYIITYNTYLAATYLFVNAMLWLVVIAVAAIILLRCWH
jgi:uncharacterized membrane protein (GlpM family)